MDINEDTLNRVVSQIKQKQLKQESFRRNDYSFEDGLMAGQGIAYEMAAQHLIDIFSLGMDSSKTTN